MRHRFKTKDPQDEIIGISKLASLIFKPPSKKNSREQHASMKADIS